MSEGLRRARAIWEGEGGADGGRGFSRARRGARKGGVKRTRRRRPRCTSALLAAEVGFGSRSADHHELARELRLEGSGTEGGRSVAAREVRLEKMAPYSLGVYAAGVDASVGLDEKLEPAESRVEEKNLVSGATAGGRGGRVARMLGVSSGSSASSDWAASVWTSPNSSNANASGLMTTMLIGATK